MTRIITALVLAAISIGVAMAQPAPSITGGPVNAASYARPGLPNAGIAQGSIFVIFGSNLGPAAIQTVSSFPLPLNLSGTSVQISMAGTNFNAIMIYTVATQVAAIVPSSVPPGDGTVTVSFSGKTSAPAPIHVVKNSFGIFSLNQAGIGPAIVTNFISQTNQPVNNILGAAQPGQVITIWGTGLGAVSGDEAAGPLPGDLNLPVDVFIGNKPATILYRGRSGCCAGLDQVVAMVPADVQGCAVSVAVRVAGVVSNFTTIAIAPGSFCSDPAGFTTDDLTPIGINGMPAISDIQLTHISANLSVPGQGSLKGTLDQSKATFRRYNTPQLLASARGVVGGLGGGIPSLGSCVVYPFSFDPSNPTGAVLPGIGDPVFYVSLDAGPALNLKGPQGTKQIARQGSSSTGPSEFVYSATIGGGIPGAGPVLPDFLASGDYTLDAGPGGPDVQSVQTSLTIPSNQVSWTNPDALGNISRSQDVTIKWSGGAPAALVAAIGVSADPTLRAGMEVVCSERAAAGQLTIPSWVLSALPATGPSQTAITGTLALGSTLGQPGRFQAVGAAAPGRVNIGFFTWVTLQVQNASFQ